MTFTLKSGVAREEEKMWRGKSANAPKCKFAEVQKCSNVMAQDCNRVEGKRCASGRGNCRVWRRVKALFRLLIPCEDSGCERLCSLSLCPGRAKILNHSSSEHCRH